MKTIRLSRWLVGLAIASTLALACSSRLRDYTQVTLVPKTDAELDSETIENTEAVLEQRLTSLGIDTAEIVSEEDSPYHIIVRLPTEVDAETVIDTFADTGQLSLRFQKPDTEEALAENIEALQRLLVEQDTLRQTDTLAEAKALRPQIEQTRDEIVDLYEPSELTGDLVEDAQAVLMSGFDTWEITVWFNDEGTEKFTQKTKAIAGTGRTIGIFLDDILLSTPVVSVDYAQTGILGGKAVISGNFTAEAAKTLETQLKSGALPVELETVDVEVVSSKPPTPPNE